MHLGQKLTMAKESLVLLLRDLTEKDYFNIVLFFNEKSIDWHPLPQQYEKLKNGQELHLTETFRGNLENIDKAAAFISQLEVTEEESENEAGMDFKDVLEHSLKLQQQVAGLPINIVSRVVLITDGGSGNSIGQLDHDQRDLERLPALTVVGVGEADIDFLQKLAMANALDYVVENVIEGMPVEDQLATTVKKHLKDVLLKNISLRYFSADEDEIVTTKNRLTYWERHRHNDSAFLVAGSLSQTASLAAIEINAHSALGEYKKRLPFRPGPKNLGCVAQAKFCTDAKFQGVCNVYNSSQHSLGTFARKYFSANISGTCAWQVFPKANYEGQSVILPALGSFEILQLGDTILYNTISSLQVRPSSNLARKIWAYLTVQDAIMSGESEVLNLAYNASVEQNFLTPFTDALFDDIGGKKVVTYTNLAPVFFQVNGTGILDCEKPEENCTNNFHFILANPRNSNETSQIPADCTGSLSLFQIAQFEGDRLEVKESMKKVYHSTAGMRIRSYQSTGNCCWQLYNNVFFTGKVKEICGDTDQLVNKNHNIGSIKIIGQQPSNVDGNSNS